MTSDHLKSTPPREPSLRIVDKRSMVVFPMLRSFLYVYWVQHVFIAKRCRLNGVALTLRISVYKAGKSLTLWGPPSPDSLEYLNTTSACFSAFLKRTTLVPLTMAQRAADPPLDEIQWRSPSLAQSMQGIHSNSGKEFLYVYRNAH